VKKAIDCLCRWPKTLVRSPCMTCWPTLVAIQVWITPKAEVTPATATMPITSHVSSRRFLAGKAVSMTARSRNGEASPTMEEATMTAVTSASCQRYGVNSRAMRSRGTSRACAFSAAVPGGSGKGRNYGLPRGRHPPPRLAAAGPDRNPGQVAGSALTALGLDRRLCGSRGAAVALGAGLGGAAAQFAAFWRSPKSS
jgi:hypothetical protein